VTLRVEILAVGTELLLGQIVDTNSTMIAQKLAEYGLESYYQTRVGDNHARIVASIRASLARSDALVICGGLGPTQDDITREAIAEVMGVELRLDEEVADRIRGFFAARGREMSENNLLQAMVPVGARIIEQRKGTAPGLICPVGHKVIYAAPGVPYELEEMLSRVILPDLLARTNQPGVIRSRVLRTWGLAESRLAEVVAPRFDYLATTANPTIAFLASGIEGIKVRVTARAETDAEATSLLDDEERELRALLGDYVFGLDDVTMEAAVGQLLRERSLSCAVAESVTGGLVASRLVSVPGASGFFRGGVVSYATDAKHELLGVPVGPVISGETAIAMARGVAKIFHCEVGLGITGVAGPDLQEGQPTGSVFVGVLLGDEEYVRELRLPGDRERIRAFAAISALDFLRLLMIGSPRRSEVGR
jgi:nicotinamide-nucleotide amidase